MDVYSFDPLADSRWDELVGRHRNASIFHTSGWLRSLQRTYGFAPLSFTTSRPTEPLRNAVVLSEVRSWLTGNRLVSLPFSDHCDPLVDHREELRALSGAVEQYRSRGGWKYAELRPTTPGLAVDASFQTGDSYYLHRLDLRPSADVLWRGFHPDSIQRRIRRAEGEPLEYEEGRSEALVAKLYHLLGLTRQRHLLPAQPLAWFRNLVDCLGSAVCIRVVSKNGEPAAGILTLTHGKTVVYKYGGSDARHHRFGGMPYLFWRMIQDAKQSAADELDLGRTDRDNSGLVIFKERWAAQRSELTYWRSPPPVARRGPSSDRFRWARRAFSGLPLGVRQATANLLYRHFA
jgi:Acetyltransferase (GNAT) domain